MNTFFEPIVTATSWMLLHSIWQFGLVFLLFYLLLRFIPEHWPQLRYLAGLLSLTAMSCWAGLTWTQNYHPATANSPATMSTIVDNETVSPVESYLPTEVETVHSVKISYFEIFKSLIDRHIHWLFAVWLFFFIVHFARFTLGLLKIHQLNNSSQSQPRLNQLLKQVQTRLNLKRKVRVKVSKQISSPWVTGMIAPVILVPFNVATGMTNQQIEHILLHELIHIRHQDFLVNLVQSLIGTIFFFNPFVFWLNESIRFERECRCDQLSLKFTDPKPYRNTLLKVMEGNLSGEFIPLGILGRPQTLFRRFQRMQYRHSTRERIWIYFLLVGLLFTFSIWTLKGQDAPFPVAQPALSDEYIPINTPDQDTIIDEYIPLYSPDEEVPEQNLPEKESLSEPEQPVLPEEKSKGAPGEEKVVQTDEARYEFKSQEDIFLKSAVSVFINGKKINPDQGFELKAIETVLIKLSSKMRDQFGPSPEMKLWLGRGKRPLDQAGVIPGETTNWNRQWDSNMIRPGDYLLVTARGANHDSNTSLFKIPIINVGVASKSNVTMEAQPTNIQDQFKVYINDKEIDPADGFPRAAIENILLAMNKGEGKASDYNVEVFLARGNRPIDKIESDNLQKIKWNLPFEDIHTGDRLVIHLTPKPESYSPHFEGPSERSAESDIIINIPVITPDDANSKHEDMDVDETKGQSNSKAEHLDLDEIKKDTVSKNIKPQEVQQSKPPIDVIINSELVNLKEGYTFNDFSPVKSIRLQYDEQDFLKMASTEPITATCYLTQGAKALVADDSPGFKKIIEAINNSKYEGSKGLRLVFEMKNTNPLNVISVPLTETSPAWVQIGQEKYGSGQIKVDASFDHLYFGISDQVYEHLQGEKINLEMFFNLKDGKKGEAVFTIQVLEDMKEGFYVQFGASVTRVLVGQKIALMGGKSEDFKQFHIDISTLKPGVNEDLLNLTIEITEGDEQ